MITNTKLKSELHLLFMIQEWLISRKLVSAKLLSKAQGKQFTRFIFNQLLDGESILMRSDNLAGKH